MNGQIKGLRAAGDFTVDIRWKNSMASEIVIYSGSGAECRPYYPNISQTVVMDKEGNTVDIEINNQHEINFKTTKGEKYILKPSLKGTK
jgi:hypothetical protein